MAEASGAGMLLLHWAAFIQGCQNICQKEDTVTENGHTRNLHRTYLQILGPRLGEEGFRGAADRYLRPVFSEGHLSTQT